MIPSNGDASGSRVTDKRLKVICGSNTSHIADGAWLGDRTPMTFGEVRVSPSNTVKPNIGAVELAEALSRVLPFTATDEQRPVFQCVKFEAKEGKLSLASSDGFRLAIVTLDYDEAEAQALIGRDDLKGIINAVKRAKRARLSFQGNGNGETDMVLDTELIRYKWLSRDGTYPDYGQHIPTESKCRAHFDTVEGLKAVASLKALVNAKAPAIDLSIGDSQIVMADADSNGKAEVKADTEGEAVKVRLAGDYLASALRACGGMVDISLKDGRSPVLFSTNGYQLVVMPMMATPAKSVTEAEAVAAEAEATEQGESEKPDESTEPVVEKPTRKRKAKEPVAVA
ncbi:hypothetical protein ACFLXE_07290 [Chloroflexota bacterium]